MSTNPPIQRNLPGRRAAATLAATAPEFKRPDGATAAAPRGRTPKEVPRFGAKIRGLRRRAELSQADLADALGISTSYLNLIENNKRPLPSALLIKLAQVLDVDLASFGSDEDARLVGELLEAFADPLFEDATMTSAEVREFATVQPTIAHEVLRLYRAFHGAQEAVDELSSRVASGDDHGNSRAAGLPSEEVSDFLQRKMNYVPELEEAAEALWKRAKITHLDIYHGLTRFLETEHGISVQIARWGQERGTLRRYDDERKILTLSELLATRSRLFQLSAQIALITCAKILDHLVDEPGLTTEESRKLARVALANYFAGAVLMPYETFLKAAKDERYDVEVLGRRFRVGFEQVCHRLTTLRRPGREGVAFHMLRIDVAGNISKRFSGSGIRFARYSGACPRWNVFSAFQTPNMVRVALSRMADGDTFFCIARTIQKDSGGYHSQQPMQAIGLGCKVEFARAMVYSDGIDLDNPALVTPVGVTCRLCERMDCEQRALPSLKVPLRVDENYRGLSLYAPAPSRT